MRLHLCALLVPWPAGVQSQLVHEAAAVHQLVNERTQSLEEPNLIVAGPGCVAVGLGLGLGLR